MYNNIMDADELKKRLEHDENKWLKVQQNQDRHHADTLNQIADLFGLVRQLQAKVNKLERLLGGNCNDQEDD